MLHPEVQTRINNIVELISDIKEPGEKLIQNQPQNRTHNINNNTSSARSVRNGGSGDAGEESDSGESDMPMMMDDDAAGIIDETIVDESMHMDPHQIKMKISELKFKKYNLKETFDNLYKGTVLFDYWQNSH